MVGTAQERLCPPYKLLCMGLFSRFCLVVAIKDVDGRERRQVYVVCARQTTMPGHDDVTHTCCADDATAAASASASSLPPTPLKNAFSITATSAQSRMPDSSS